MKNIFSLTILILLSKIATAQTGINTLSPNASAALDIVATDRGVLLPKYTLLTLDDSTSPVNDPAQGSLIYNQAGTHEKGYYYWDGTKWNRLIVNKEIAKVLNLNLLGNFTPSNTDINYLSFTSANTVFNTLDVANPIGTDIILPAGTYKVDISIDCYSSSSTNTNTIATGNHLFVLDAAIVTGSSTTSSYTPITDVKTISDISSWGGNSIQGYSFVFVFTLATQQSVKILLKNGSGSTSNVAKTRNQAGISVTFLRMFQ